MSMELTVSNRLSALLKRHCASLVVVVLFLIFVLLLRIDHASAMKISEKLFVEFPVSENAPTLEVSSKVEQGAVALSLLTENFNFSAVCSSANALQADAVTQGHAHVYVNGKRYGSFDSPDFKLFNLPSGEHTLTVSLNVLPDHRFITHKGVPVQDEFVVSIP